MQKTAQIIALCVGALTLLGFQSHSSTDTSNSHASNCANSSTLNGCTLSSTGAINLSRMNNNILIKMNQNVKGDLKVFHSEANNRDSIRGSFFLNNKSNEKVYIKYRLIFKDKVGVVAQTTGEIHLKPGNNQRKKFGNIVLGQQDIKNIHSYQIHMVVSSHPTFKN